MYMLKVNGLERNVDAPLEKPLLWVLREEFNLLGTKFGCGFGVCGACTVLVDGEAMQTCVMSLEEALDKEITTIEGLNNDLGTRLKEQWVKESVPQCGYCQPGFIMSAAALFKNGEEVNEEAIYALPNVCRCGTYQRIKKAITEVAKDDIVWEVQP